MRIKLTTSLMITLAFLSLSASGFASSDILEDIKACARTDDTAERNACYEALGNRVLAEESVATEVPADIEPVPVEPPDVADQSTQAAVTEAVVAETVVAESAEVEAVAPEPEAARLPDDLGAESREKESFRGHVRSCGQLSGDKWHFVFNSGQV